MELTIMNLWWLMSRTHTVEAGLVTGFHFVLCRQIAHKGAEIGLEERIVGRPLDLFTGVIN